MKATWTLAALAAAVALAGCGDEETSIGTVVVPVPLEFATPGATAPSSTAAVQERAALGRATYELACASCHEAGVAGAPRPGDADDWAGRLGQGTHVLYAHALRGYEGRQGFMPPKGGFGALRDEQVRAAVDYMLAQPG